REFALLPPSPRRVLPLNLARKTSPGAQTIGTSLIPADAVDWMRLSSFAPLSAGAYAAFGARARTRAHAGLVLRGRDLCAVKTERVHARRKSGMFIVGPRRPRGSHPKLASRNEPHIGGARAGILSWALGQWSRAKRSRGFGFWVWRNRGPIDNTLQRRSGCRSRRRAVRARERGVRGAASRALASEPNQEQEDERAIHGRFDPGVVGSGPDELDDAAAPHLSARRWTLKRRASGRSLRAP
ncbi:MAG: hypothetical protein RJA70_2291, partial [Pseudomonadota bacterium]